MPPVREAHHRIKNHLQGVAGLLRQHLGDKPLLQPLLESGHGAEVPTIAAVHYLHGELEGGCAGSAGLADAHLQFDLDCHPRANRLE